MRAALRLVGVAVAAAAALGSARLGSASACVCAFTLTRNLFFFARVRDPHSHIDAREQTLQHVDAHSFLHTNTARTNEQAVVVAVIVSFGCTLTSSTLICTSSD